MNRAQVTVIGITLFLIILHLILISSISSLSAQAFTPKQEEYLQKFSVGCLYTHYKNTGDEKDSYRFCECMYDKIAEELKEVTAVDAITLRNFKIMCLKKEEI